MKQNDDVFEMETEALALKNNQDYLKLVQCLAVLSGLREQALEDLNQVFRVQDRALSDPAEFTRMLRNGENLGIPDRLPIPDLPQIDWENYKIHPFEEFRPSTRPKSRERPSENLVRGRVKDESKPASFNQPWTAEEQARLEQLLIEFPSDDNEAKRFKKIAKALGNRTLSQVTSRCQKYFIKLHKAGLPVPGRVPRRVREGSSKKLGYKGFKATPEVTFSDYAEVPDQPVANNLIKIEVNAELSDTELTQQSIADRKLCLLRRVRTDLMRQTDSTITHPDYTCNICKDEPLRGTRWHCAICPDMDVCSWCLIEQLEADTHEHPLDHPLISYRPIAGSMEGGDQDYARPMDNYLDTNFQPS